MKHHEYKRTLERLKIEPTEENLEKAFKILKKGLGLKNVKVFFDDNIKLKNNFEGFTLIRQKRLFRIFVVGQKYIVRLNRNNFWIFVLIHEVTHILMFKKTRTHRHNKTFYKVQRLLLDNFFAKIVTAFKN